MLASRNKILAFLRPRAHQEKERVFCSSRVLIRHDSTHNTCQIHYGVFPTVLEIPMPSFQSLPAF